MVTISISVYLVDTSFHMPRFNQKVNLVRTPYHTDLVGFFHEFYDESTLGVC